jgi:hypothetical protein
MEFLESEITLMCWPLGTGRVRHIGEVDLILEVTAYVLSARN